MTLVMPHHARLADRLVLAARFAPHVMMAVVRLGGRDGRAGERESNGGGGDHGTGYDIRFHVVLQIERRAAANPEIYTP